MTKTKRQLRAEAVERLKDAQTNNLDWMLLGDECPNWVNYDTLSYNKAVRERVADLLTDDDANDDSAHESGVRMASMGANDVKVSTMPLKMPSEIEWHYTDGGEYIQELTGDSREKLEADIKKYRWEHGETNGRVTEWLDRQAAITQHEITERWAEHLHPIERKCGDLRRKVDELTDERDELQRQLDILRDVTREFRDERDEYREKLSRALDLAHEIGRLQP